VLRFDLKMSLHMAPKARCGVILWRRFDATFLVRTACTDNADGQVRPELDTYNLIHKLSVPVRALALLFKVEVKLCLLGIRRMRMRR
jgi:hypothetical protein